MQVKVRKYMTGSFVETYEVTLEVPNDIDPDDAVNYLDENGMLDDADWQQVSMDDNIDNVEYEIEDVIQDEEEGE